MRHYHILWTFLATLAIVPNAFASSIEFTNSWVRQATKGDNSAVYMAIYNKQKGLDKLVSVTTDVCDRVFIYETTPRGAVSTLSYIAVGAGEELVLEPGGMHIGLEGLKKSLVSGSTISVTLHFEKAGAVSLQIPAAQSAPVSPSHDCGPLLNAQGINEDVGIASA